MGTLSGRNTADGACEAADYVSLRWRSNLCVIMAYCSHESVPSAATAGRHPRSERMDGTLTFLA